MSGASQAEEKNLRDDPPSFAELAAQRSQHIAEADRLLAELAAGKEDALKEIQQRVEEFNRIFAEDYSLTRLPKRTRKAKAARKCTSCQQAGHDSRNCPTKAAA